MFRKLIFVMSFVFVPALFPSSAAGVADEDLVGWWRFEEGSGTTARDSSRYGNDGSLINGATWTTGRFGGGIELDGSTGYVLVPDFELMTDTITFVAWLNGWKANDWAPLISSREVNPCEMKFGDNDTLHYVWNNDSHATFKWAGGPVIPQDTWAMLAISLDPAGVTAYVYTEEEGLAQGTNSMITHFVQTVGFLQLGYSYDDRYVRGIIDEAAIYKRALTESEILKLAVRQEAYAPIPAYGAEDVPLDVNLVWTRGIDAASEEVWFGTDPCSLSHVTDIIVTPTSAPLYAPPGDLIASTTYYWQIVESNDPHTYPGPVWKFSTISGAAEAYYPPDGTVITGDVVGSNIWTKLIFNPGPTAVSHTGYFNEDYSKVEGRAQDANLGEPPFGSVPGWEHTFFAGNPQVPPADETLVRGISYYWTVDETDAWGNTFGGETWEFTVLGYKAFDPNPPNGAVFISPPDVLLSWREGTGMTEHDVYMGTSRQDVNNAVYDVNSPAPEFLATITEPNYQYSGLEYETRYYWRVDEITGRSQSSGGTIYKGDVWEFTTQLLTTEYRDKGYLYLSPLPRAEYVSPQTKYFLVRFETVSPNDITNLSTFIEVTGQISGPHPGLTKVATDGRTVIFDTSLVFSNDELVTVTLTPTVDPCAAGVVEPFQYQFMITGPMPGSPRPLLPLAPPGSGSAAGEQVANAQAKSETESTASPTAEMIVTTEDTASATASEECMIMENGVSVPSDFPQVVITVNNNPSPGYIFIQYPHYGDREKYSMMLDNNGLPVWYRRGGNLWNEFKVQRNGTITMGIFTGYDQNFNWVRYYSAVNGHNTDHHDLEVLEDGGYLMIGGRNNTVDMSLYIPDGNSSANVHETIVQEFTAAGELIFQFRSWDNFDISDVEAMVEDPLSENIRFPHINATDVDEDGHLLISCRHISEITKINRDSGEIIWRLCGSDPERSDFTFVNDPLNGFSHQHDIRALGNRRYLLFDNGNGHNPPVSRVIEYELDLNSMTATLVWQFRDTPDKYAHYMGSAQRLPNGNTLINFVLPEYPKALEVDPNGVKRFELDFRPRSSLYKVNRFPWDGMVEVPYLILESATDYITLIFNKFGDPNVAYYRIYGGTAPQPTTLLDTSTSTLKHLRAGLESGREYYFRVTSVDIGGTESDYSNEESIVISFTGPGENMVLDGDFCGGNASWIWEVDGEVSAEWNTEDSVSHFNIAYGGTQITDVQLRQAGIKLTRGREYIFEFDAWSDMPRYIEAKVGQDKYPWTNYSNIGYSSVTPNPTHFRYRFTMQDPSDYNARVVFNAGSSNIDVYIDNVSLINVLPGDFDCDGCVRLDDLAVLTSEWLEERSGLMADLYDNGKVDFDDFAIFADSFKYPCSTTLVTEKDARRVLVPTNNIGYDWIGNAEPYDDSGWEQIGASDCPSGVGYENSPGDAVNYTDLFAHDVYDQMFNTMASCYIRIPFVLDMGPNVLSSITLKIRYDDGFVAYINGRELARDNFEAEIPEWNDNADRSHNDSEARLLQSFRVNSIDNPEVFNALQSGDNILAIHGLNVSINDSDFLISAELHAGY